MGVLDIPCVILAGGKSRRFGMDKGLAELAGTPLIERVEARLRGQTGGPIVINTASVEGYQGFSGRLLSDRIVGDVGPLAGLHAALSWAGDAGYERVVTAPVDTPFLPLDLIAKLASVGGVSVAKSSRLHPVCGCWSTALVEDIEAAITSGLRAVHCWAEQCDAVAVEFEATDGIDPFFNINTGEDLEAAAALLA